MLTRIAACLVVAASLVLPLLSANAATVRRSIQYGADPAQALDLYLPDGRVPAGLVVYVHGGWNGRRGRVGPIAAPLNQAGFAIADVDYRPIPPNNVQGAVQDVANAAAFLLAHARDFHLRTDKFAVSGNSAGGNVAALIATDPAYLQRAGVDPTRLAGALLLDGVYDVAANVQNYPSAHRDEVFGADPAVWRRLSPAVQVAGLRTHPRFCVAGEDRSARMSQQTEIFERALRATGQTMETVTASGFKHGDMRRRFDDPAGPLAAFATACLTRAFAP